MTESLTFRPRTRLVAGALFAGALTALAAARVHVRVQATLVGYELGRLKAEEGRLLEARSALKMQLAKLTTKRHLQLITETEGRPTTNRGTLALK